MIIDVVSTDRALFQEALFKALWLLVRLLWQELGEVAWSWVGRWAGQVHWVSAAAQHVFLRRRSI